MTDVTRLETKFHQLLQEQIRSEFGASQQYIAVAVYFDGEDLPQLAKHFYAQAVEERDEAAGFARARIEGEKAEPWHPRRRAGLLGRWQGESQDGGQQHARDTARLVNASLSLRHPTDTVAISPQAAPRATGTHESLADSACRSHADVTRTKSMRTAPMPDSPPEPAA